jgi:hypothetical protein
MALPSLHERLNGEAQEANLPISSNAYTNSSRKLSNRTLDTIKSSKRLRAIVGIGVAAVTLGGFAAIVSPNQSEAPSVNRQETNGAEQQGIYSNGLPDSTTNLLQPNNVPLLVEPPKHFTVNAVPFENRELGAYTITNETLSASIRNVRHDIIIKTARLVFTTNGAELLIDTKDGALDKATNTITQDTKVHADSLKYGASLDTLHMRLKTISTGDILKERHEYKIGCGTLAVWGCPHGSKAPKAATLSVFEQRQLFMTAELIIAQNIFQQCGPIEDLSERQKIRADIEKQVNDQGFEPRLVTISFTAKGSPATTLPNYIYDLQKQLVKQGAITNPKKIKALYSVDPNGTYLKTMCAPILIATNNP